jgi:hypothetical protein
MTHRASPKEFGRELLKIAELIARLDDSGLRELAGLLRVAHAVGKESTGMHWLRDLIDRMRA